MSIRTEVELTQQARTRLRRIEGQVRGLQGMLDKLDGCCENSTPCDHLLTQVLAVRAAIEQVGLIVLDIHLQECILEGVEVDDAKIKELRDSIKLWSRLGSG